MNDIATQLRQVLLRDPRTLHAITASVGMGHGGSLQKFHKHGTSDLQLSTAMRLADALDCDIVLVPRYDGK
jgi:hypothetical protein